MTDLDKIPGKDQCNCNKCVRERKSPFSPTQSEVDPSPRPPAKDARVGEMKDLLRRAYYFSIGDPTPVMTLKQWQEAVIAILSESPPIAPTTKEKGGTP